MAPTLGHADPLGLLQGGGANWFIMLGGINDITHDVAIATTKANLAQMWSEAKRSG